MAVIPTGLEIKFGAESIGMEVALPIKIVRIRSDEAPNSADRLAIHMRGCGLYAWSGAIELNRRAVFGGSDPEFKTAHAAETAALTWAIRQGSTEVMILGADT